MLATQNGHKNKAPLRHAHRHSDGPHSLAGRQLVVSETSSRVCPIHRSDVMLPTGASLRHESAPIAVGDPEIRPLEPARGTYVTVWPTHCNSGGNMINSGT
jgi:hypothetical protein